MKIMTVRVIATVALFAPLALTGCNECVDEVPASATRCAKDKDCVAISSACSCNSGGGRVAVNREHTSLRFCRRNCLAMVNTRAKSCYARPRCAAGSCVMDTKDASVCAKQPKEGAFSQAACYRAFGEKPPSASREGRR